MRFRLQSLHLGGGCRCCWCRACCLLHFAFVRRQVATFIRLRFPVLVAVNKLDACTQPSAGVGVVDRVKVLHVASDIVALLHRGDSALVASAGGASARGRRWDERARRAAAHAMEGRRHCLSLSHSVYRFPLVRLPLRCGASPVSAALPQRPLGWLVQCGVGHSVCPAVYRPFTVAGYVEYPLSTP